MKDRIRQSWKVQRFNKGVDYINPFGNVALEIDDKKLVKVLTSIIEPDYMGAAEYEWGAFPKCLAKMWDTPLEIDNTKINDTKVYVVYPTQDMFWEDDKISFEAYIKDINAMYNMTDTRGGKVNEIAKSDYGSFKQAIDGKNDKTIGWLSLSNHYAWFLNEDIAINFGKLVNYKQ
jgi:hypothetical protein